MVTTSKSEIVCNAFVMSGIEPARYATHLKILIDKPQKTGDLWSREEMFNHGLFVIQSKRLILLLGA